MAGLKALTIKYGPSYAFSLNVNDGTNYIAASYDMFGSPEQDVLLAEATIGFPQYIRTKLKERVFSIRVTLNVTPYGIDYNTLLNALKIACIRPQDEQIKLVVEREGVGNLSLICTSEGIKQQDSPCDFLISFKAANPIFTLDAADASASDTQPPSGAYVPVPVTGYAGTAPAEPVVTLTVVNTSNVWKYTRTVTVTNRSPWPLSNYPVCIQLGNVNSLISGGKMRSDLGDIRLESPGGARKQIYVRDRLGDKTDVRVWFVMYSLAAGETKTLRLLYGNLSATADTEDATTKPMFSMPSSDNSAWIYQQFRPVSGQPQTRAAQWGVHSAWAKNLTAILNNHADFVNSLPLEVPCAGARPLSYGTTYGYAGLELITPVGIRQVDFGYKTRTSGSKCPFVFRSRGANNTWTERYIDTVETGQRAYLTANAALGATTISVSIASQFSVGNSVTVQFSDGTSYATTVTAVNTTAGTLTLASGLTKAGTANNTYVWRYLTGLTGPAQSIALPADEAGYPFGIMFGLKGANPALNCGEWYYGAAETATVYFDTAAYPLVTLGAEAGLLYHLRGTVKNSYTGEELSINTVMFAIGDKLVIDCENRTCTYYNAAGTVTENRFDALTFTAPLGQYWMHIEPAPGVTQNVTFSGDNMYNLNCAIGWPVKYY